MIFRFLSALLFYVFCIIWGFLFVVLLGISSVLAFVFRFHWLNQLHLLCRRIQAWGVTVFLRYMNGIKVMHLGRTDLIGSKNVLLACNHQSGWETYYLYGKFPKISPVAKRSLLFVPVLGISLLQSRAILLNRKKKIQALKYLTQAAANRLKQGRNILIFPEGTRVKPGQQKPLGRSVSIIATNVKATILPIIHNSGEVWPKNSVMKIPGTIYMHIGDPIDASDQTIGEVHQALHQAFEKGYEAIELQKALALSESA